MSKYDTPKNGDFAKYIEQLSHQSSSKTNATVNSNTRKPSLPPLVPTTVKHNPKKSIPPPSRTTQQGERPTQATPTKLTLAQRAAQRRQVQLLGVLAIGAIVWAVILFIDSSLQHGATVASKGLLIPAFIGIASARAAWRKHKQISS